jgi:hypothetical protein
MSVKEKPQLTERAAVEQSLAVNQREREAVDAEREQLDADYRAATKRGDTGEARNIRMKQAALETQRAIYDDTAQALEARLPAIARREAAAQLPALVAEYRQGVADLQQQGTEAVAQLRQAVVALQRCQQREVELKKLKLNIWELGRLGGRTADADLPDPVRFDPSGIDAAVNDIQLAASPFNRS